MKFDISVLFFFNFSPNFPSNPVWWQDYGAYGQKFYFYNFVSITSSIIKIHISHIEKSAKKNVIRHHKTEQNLMTGFKNISYIIQLSHFRSLRKIPQCSKKQKKFNIFAKKLH